SGRGRGARGARGGARERRGVSSRGCYGLVARTRGCPIRTAARKRAGDTEEMTTKKIGVLFGQEDTFPWAVMNEINVRAQASGEAIEGVPVKIGALSQDQSFDYAVILDRISHEVPFYRTFLKCALARGVQVVNNPIWWSADDKFFDNVVAQAAGVEVPRTVLLPHKEHPPNTSEKSF